MQRSYAGYLAGLNYTHGFFRELTPAVLSLVLLGRGLATGQQEDHFTWCELGCGHGVTPIVLAAANPHGEFFATDINSDHIAWAKGLADSAKLPNVHFFDQSFEEFLTNSELPQFDYVVLHGIYSWVGNRQREEIKEFLRKKLKIGGVAYLSYNSFPGALAELPLRELIIRVGDQSMASSLTRVEQAIEFVGRLRDVNAGFIGANPTLIGRLEYFQTANKSYVAHEYLNANWSPLYHHEMMADMAESNLGFAGSATILDDLPLFNLTPPQQEFLSGIAEPVWQETLKDFMSNQRFRRDVFVRGSLRLNASQTADAWSERSFVLVVSRHKASLTVERPNLKADLRPEIYEPLLDTLETGPASFEDLAGRRELKAIDVPALREALLVLVGAGYVEPCLPRVEQEARRATTQQLNQEIMTRALDSGEIEVLASPVTGGGIRVSRFEQLFVLALGSGEDPVRFTWRALEQREQRIVKDDGPLITADENLAELRDQFRQFKRELLPVLKRVGVTG